MPNRTVSNRAMAIYTWLVADSPAPSSPGAADAQVGTARRSERERRDVPCHPHCSAEAEARLLPLLHAPRPSAARPTGRGITACRVTHISREPASTTQLPEPWARLMNMSAVTAASLAPLTLMTTRRMWYVRQRAGMLHRQDRRVGVAQGVWVRIRRDIFIYITAEAEEPVCSRLV